MATTLYKTYRVPAAPALCLGYFYQSWERGQRDPNPPHRIILQPHAFQRFKCSYREQKTGTLNSFSGADLQINTGPGVINSASGNYDSAFWAPIDNRVYGKFYRKLRDSKANLGISFLEIEKSFRMITDRCHKLSKFLSESERQLWANRRVVRRRAGLNPTDHRAYLQARASDVLEGEFGWMPIVEDIQNSMKVLANGVPESPWVRASVKVPISLFKDDKGVQVRTTDSWNGWVRVTYSAKCSVTNPNLWLLNQLGLINPATIAVDKIPWSWVVGMFVNMTQMLNSFTDDIGVNIAAFNITRSREVTRDQLSFGVAAPWLGMQTVGYSEITEKKRYLTSTVPRPKVVLHWPKADWNLALIASAVMLQRLEKLNRTAARVFGYKAPVL